MTMITYIIILHITIAANGQNSYFDRVMKPKRVLLGAIFHHDQDLKHELVFKNAVLSLNDPKENVSNTINFQPEVVKIRNSLEAEAAVCYLIHQGVAGIFGPDRLDPSEHVKSICDRFEIPYIETFMPSGVKAIETHDKINIFPSNVDLSRLLTDIMISSRWDSLIILYEKQEYLSLIQNLMALTKVRFIIKQIVKAEKGIEYRNILESLLIYDTKIILLLSRVTSIEDILKQAQQIGLVSDEYTWILGHLDSHTVNLEDYKYDDTNITLIRMVNPESYKVKEVIKEIVQSEWDIGKSLDFTEFSGGVTLSSAIIYDSIQVFAQAFRNLDSVQNILMPNGDYCKSFESWSYGSSLINYIKLVEMENGLTGNFKIAQNGTRVNFEVELLKLDQIENLISVGIWDSVSGMKIKFSQRSSDKYNTKSKNIETMTNRTFIFTTVLTAPYVMLNQTIDKLEGNARFEGFAVDLVHELSKVLNFNYTFKLANDENYGSVDERGQWNGMVKEVIDGVADFAIADLSITTSRASVVDFSIPWMNLGISILYLKPRDAPPSFLSFLEPFTSEVWIYTGVSLIFVSVVTFYCARFSPFEWINPYPCIMKPSYLENQFSPVNSFWCAFGSFMQQGTEYAPVAFSTRMIYGVWYFFTLVLVSSYTANLAASLTAVTLERPIKSAEDLAEQTSIKYGVQEGGSTMNFFKRSNMEPYDKMWNFMSDPGIKPLVMVNSNAEGIEKVEKEDGKYAFMMESSSIQYIVERRCKLAQIGGLLDSKGYGIAIRQGESKLKSILDSGILTLMEGGTLFKLKTKWWKQKRGGGQCNSNGSSSSANELSLDNMGGVFMVTFLGCLIASVICFGEFLLGAKHQAKLYGTSWMAELTIGLRFACRCRGNIKFVRPVRHSSSSPRSQTSPTPPPTNSISPNFNHAYKRHSYHCHHLF